MYLRKGAAARAQVGGAQLEQVAHVLGLLLQALLAPRLAFLRAANNGRVNHYRVRAHLGWPRPAPHDGLR